MRARHRPGTAGRGQVAPRGRVRRRGPRTSDGPRGTDPFLRRRRHVRAARRVAVAGGRASHPETPRRSRRRSANGWPLSPTGGRRRPARAGPRCRRGARVRRLLGGQAPARGPRLRAAARRGARGRPLGGAADARPRGCGRRACPRSRALPVPREARAPRTASHLGGREAARDHHDPSPALAGGCPAGRGAPARAADTHTRRRPGL